jgi:DNA end-binding protein Ku
MRPLWKGTISFGLVTIPVSLYPAIRREELKFRLLRKSDLSPINYKRVAEADGKEVSWDHIVKGYEYEKGKCVVLKDEDFARVDVEATQTVDIINFVAIEEVDPLFFYKPYYLEVGKGGQKAYVLLRDALVEAGRIGIARVVIRAREHLAAVKPQKSVLMLELMHFPSELADASEFKGPTVKSVGKSELRMALQLIESMTTGWEPEKYTDEYREALKGLIEEKIEHGEKATPAPVKKKRPSNVVDLVSILQKSIAEAGNGNRAVKRKAKTRAKSRTTPKRKKAA